MFYTPTDSIPTSDGVNFLFDVLFHEIMETHPSARAGLNNKLAKLYTHYTPIQRQALDEVFSELFHQSYSDCFSLNKT
jgi:ABC-type transporter MlaC component